MPKLLLPFIFLLAISRAALRLAITPYFPELMARYGIGYTKMGVLYSAFVISLVACQVPMGIIADRVQARKLLAGGLLTLAAAGLGFLTVNSWGGGLALRIVMGAACATIFPVVVRLVHQMVPPGRHGTAMSFDEGGIAFATVVAMAVLPMLAGHVGFAASQIALAALTLALSLWVWRGLPRGQVAANLPAAGGQAKPGAAAEALCTRYSLGRRVLFLILTASPAIFVYNAAVTWMPTYLRGALGYGTQTAGLILTALTGSYFVMSVVSGRICDRFDRQMPLTLIGNLLLAAGFVVLLAWPSAGGTAGLALLGVLMGPGLALAIVPMLVVLPTLFGTARTGLGAALLAMSAQGGAILGSITIGYLVDRTGHFTAAWLLCIALLALRSGALFLVKESGRRRGRPAGYASASPR